MPNDDVVERLKKSQPLFNPVGSAHDIREAIAEITRLRATVRNDQEFDKIERTYIQTIERLRAEAKAMREALEKITDVSQKWSHIPIYTEACCHAIWACEEMDGLARNALAQGGGNEW